MNRESMKSALARWLPILVGMFIATLSLLLWRALEVQERANIEHMIESDADRVQNEITERVKTHAMSLARMARRWEIQGKPDRKIWEDDARLYYEHFPGTQGITWVDASYRIGWIIPVRGNERALGLYLGFEKRRLLAMEEARERREVRITPPIELVQGGKGIIIFAPIFTGERFDGFIDGVFRTQAFLDAMLENIAPGYFISISSGGEEIYRRGEAAESIAEWGRETTVSLYGTDWRVRLAPTPKFLEGMRSDAEDALPVAGFVIAWIFALTVRLSQNASRRARETEAARMELEKEVGQRQRAEETLRESEAKYRLLNEELERKVEERTGDLIEAQEELVQTEKLAMLGRIAGNMGNELLNPLGVMNNAVFYLGSVLPDADKTVRGYLDIIRGEIGNSQRIISDLLDFASSKSPRRQAVKADELIKECMGRCAIPECVHLQACLPETLPEIKVDPLQMGQVIRNLITNAVQAMPDGGTLRIGARCRLVPGSRFLVPGSNQEQRTKNQQLKTRNQEPGTNNPMLISLKSASKTPARGLRPKTWTSSSNPSSPPGRGGSALALRFPKSLPRQTAAGSRWRAGWGKGRRSLWCCRLRGETGGIPHPSGC